MSKAIICNRCGKTFSPEMKLDVNVDMRDSYPTVSLEVRYMYGNFKYDKRLTEKRDLCHECSDDFYKFMKGESNE